MYASGKAGNPSVWSTPQYLQREPLASFVCWYEIFSDINEAQTGSCCNSVECLALDSLSVTEFGRG